MNTPAEKAIRLKIKELRKKLRLTQSQFAALVDLSTDCIGKIERGTSMPSLETLYKITTALNIPADYLLSAEKQKNRTEEIDTALNNLVDYLKTKSSDDIHLIHDIAVMILERRKEKCKV